MHSAVVVMINYTYVFSRIPIRRVGKFLYIKSTLRFMHQWLQSLNNGPQIVGNQASANYAIFKALDLILVTKLDQPRFLCLNWEPKCRKNVLMQSIIRPLVDNICLYRNRIKSKTDCKYIASSYNINIKEWQWRLFQ